jgi:hypothetical protein
MIIVIVISKKEIKEIQNINFHDAEIAKIICDYYEGTVEMPIIMDNTHRYAALLRFESMLHIEVNRKEPWGPGMYISSVDEEDVEGDYFKVSFLLNSGDEVNIVASKMIYSSDSKVREGGI